MVRGEIMKKIIVTAVILLIAALFISSVSAEPTLGGDMGTVVVKSNAEGATVTLLSINSNSAYTETVQDGQAVIAVHSTATPVDKAIVFCDGYKPAYCVIETPAKDETLTYTVNLEEIQKPEGFIGGDKGYILIAKNSPGTKVELLDASSNVLYEGTLDENGVIIFEVYTTATPIKSMRIGDEENAPAISIASPASGQTLAHYMMDGNTPTPVETQKDKPPYMETPTEQPSETPASPLGLAGIFGIFGASLLLRRK